MYTNIKHIGIILILTVSFLSCSKSDGERISLKVQSGKNTKELTVNGTTREYIIHIPENYTRKTPLPILLSFHGLSSNMEYNYNYTKFHELAESENFIVVHPNGISKRWSTSNLNNADIDFIITLLNQLEGIYNIDPNRIYSTGMSMGGFFSFNLACKLSDRIAAIGSVTGSMYQRAINSCTPSRPMPILQIHGTEDDIVPYSGIADVLDYWTNYNNTDTNPIKYNIPDINPNDGNTVERFDYLNGDKDVEVIHYKITGGGHKWPGYQGNMDINASKEVWDFVKKFDLNGKIK